MIEFNGELSSNCKEYILKREVKLGFIATTLVALLFLIPAIIATILWDWIFIIMVLIFILIILSSLKRPSEKHYGKIFPKRVTILENKIESQGDNFLYVYDISNVKKVVDFGEWYHVIFNFNFKNPRFICQKDLIRKGTLEEFEKLFEGKIIKKK